jgi:hypothetical protein
VFTELLPGNALIESVKKLMLFEIELFRNEPFIVPSFYLPTISCGKSKLRMCCLRKIDIIDAGTSFNLFTVYAVDPD